MNLMESVRMKKGFTLIELIVVIALIGVIAEMFLTLKNLEVISQTVSFPAPPFPFMIITIFFFR